jgi:DNA-binding LacI/PurR family transcriptional regulator
MKYTIKDIANLAGVSKSTVSRIISESGYTSREARQKVLKAIEELKYTPNGLARAMVSRRTNTIGVIILVQNDHVISHPFYGKILDGILLAADHHHYSVYVTTEKEMSLRSTEDMIEKRVEGLILVSRLREEMIDYIDNFKVPYIMVNGTVEKDHVIQIVNDDWKGGELAADHLYDIGHRRFGIIAGPQNHRSHFLRYSSFCQRLSERGCPIDEENIYYSPTSNFHEGRKAFWQIWGRSHPKPTAIFATNDMLALGAIREIYEAGIKIPDELAIMGFDDIDFSSISSPSLTTIHVEKKQMGYDAVAMLNRLIEKKKVEPQRLEFEPRLIIRGSTQKRIEDTIFP